MTENTQRIRRVPKYDPPYPQGFYAFWPTHVIKGAVILTVIYAGVFALASLYRVPMDPDMPPLPYEGANIPAPEWYLFLMYQPFWYLTGEDMKWLSVGTFWIPWLVVAIMFLVPVVLGRKESTGRMGTLKKVLMALVALGIWGLGGTAVIGSSYPAKTTGCPSCHNPMMGARQSLPPEMMGDYYKTERQRQIDLGGYRAGSTAGVGDSYKDANWQLRHFYEPTMTW